MNSYKFKNLNTAPFEYFRYTSYYGQDGNYKKKEKIFSHKKHSLNFIKTPNLYTWQNQYKNIHFAYKSIKIREIVSHTLKKRGFHLNLFFLKKFHNNFSLNTKFFSYYTPKFTKVFRNLKKNRNRRKNLKKKPLHITKLKSKFYYKNHSNFNKNKVFRKMFKAKTSVLKQKTFNALQTARYNALQSIRHSDRSFRSMAKAICSLSFSPRFSLRVWIKPLPKTYVIDNACQAFNRFKNNIHFWSGLQSLRLVVNGKGSSQLLADYVASGVRRNRKRVAFIMYLKRLIDWHFKSIKNLKIQGIRIETKGRFNAKSRCRKYILCVGRVAKGEKTSNVDYAFTKAITVFGSLGIKVWICPN